MTTKVIVITTVRDEAWTLDRFFQTCSEFADHILVDDDSTGIDHTHTIYPRYSKVILFKSAGTGLSFETRRKRIFAEARRIACDRRIIVAIDSDELISANLLHSPEWRTVLTAPPGTSIYFHRYDLWKTADRYRDEGSVPGLAVSDRTIWVDDGISELPEKGYQGMHMAYAPESARAIRLHQIVALHYQFCNQAKVASRYRFYRAHEKANIRKHSDLAIWRIYSQHEIASTNTFACPREWFQGWEDRGIDMTSSAEEDLFHYDVDVLKLLAQHGSAFFGRQDLWFANWSALAELAKARGFLAPDYNYVPFHRSFGDRLFHIYARRTNNSYRWKRFESRLLTGGAT